MTTTTNVIMAPVLPQLSSYDGRTSCADFLTRFVLLGDVSGWDDTKRASYFSLYLKGTAQNWYVSYISDRETRGITTKPTWTELKDAFRVAFKSKLSEEELEQRILERKKGEDENISDYYYGILRLCSKADKKMSEEKKIKFLLKGMSPKLTLEVYNTEPKDTQAVLDYLERREKFDFLIGRQVDKDKRNKKTDEQIAGVVKNMQGFQSALDKMASRFAKLRVNQVNTKTTGRSYGTHQHKRENTEPRGSRPTVLGPYNRRPKPPDQTTTGERLCYNCGKPGHYAKDCKAPKKKKDKENIPPNEESGQEN